MWNLEKYATKMLDSSLALKTKLNRTGVDSPETKEDILLISFLVEIQAWILEEFPHIIEHDDYQALNVYIKSVAIANPELVTT